MGVDEGMLSRADEGAKGAKIRGRVSEADDDALNIVDIVVRQRELWEQKGAKYLIRVTLRPSEKDCKKRRAGFDGGMGSKDGS